MKSLKRITLFMCILFSINNAWAQDYSHESQVLLKNLQRKITNTLLYVSENESNAGNDIKDFNYHFSLPANKHINLGLVIGAYKTKQGYEVISVTPGSEADKKGIKAHDFITKINQVEVENLSSKEILNSLYNLQPDQRITLEVKSGDNLKTIFSKLSVIERPRVYFNLGELNNDSEQSAKQNYPENSCGQITVNVRPPKSMGNLRGIRFRKIDNSIVSFDINSTKLSPGRHRLDFNVASFYTERVHNKIPPIEMDIAPNTHYFLAAKWINKSARIVKWRIKSEQCEK